MRLHTLQYLRAVAALAVVYSHSVIQVDDYALRLPEFGGFGVDIFFVISGFIMVFISKPTNTPRQFFINRARRVIPLYWFFTLLMAAILLLAPSVFKATVFDLSVLLKSLAFVPHYSLVQPYEVWPMLAPGWSLNYEMYFYLLFALSLFLPRWRITFISIAILLVYIVANFVDTSGVDTSGVGMSGALQAFYSDAIVFEFIFGMLLAVAWKNDFKLPPVAGMVLLAVGFLLLFLRLPVPRILEFGIPSLFVVAGCLYVQVPANKLGLLLGDASYALYLSHIFTLGVLRQILPPILGDGAAAPVLFVAISLIVCIVVSVFVHIFVDNWLLRSERFSMGSTPRQSNNSSVPTREQHHKA